MGGGRTQSKINNNSVWYMLPGLGSSSHCLGWVVRKSSRVYLESQLPRIIGNFTLISYYWVKVAHYCG